MKLSYFVIGAALAISTAYSNTAKSNGLTTTPIKGYLITCYIAGGIDNPGIVLWRGLAVGEAQLSYMKQSCYMNRGTPDVTELPLR
ncbi:hypothetical protein [Pseudoalteromonas luteoviolacea]|uniref:Uncharacterized protein n=1 Tax=Pseudoalteromonas luteoviolacea H33 TaxID=1365251 RepID=A0A167DRV1_9GAMM|nr:hypothetical protein [Pseudoalteromonas luteoviolacea]KZN49268.1 hypothetical protein N476_19665 [Pseudoalteromonas luteoviolacea H33]KZN74929.1 hypothetical protein N477_21125 [Pseudoalteromonas luteoviolacea H33-S]MBQ4878377.1 hypothetical protein [Pseudoalteromonas luteoviolacea]MBQ4907532.1 hypothetical protein [Pseudoalteromonas luteoviolacea]